MYSTLIVETIDEAIARVRRWMSITTSTLQLRCDHCKRVIGVIPDRRTSPLGDPSAYVRLMFESHVCCRLKD